MKPTLHEQRVLSHLGLTPYQLAVVNDLLISARKKRATSPKPKLVGRTTWLKDCCCAPKQSGACRIVALSSQGPEWVVVEWTQTDFHQTAGQTCVVKLSDLDVR